MEVIYFKSNLEFGKYGKIWMDLLVKEGFHSVNRMKWVSPTLLVVEGVLDIWKFDKFVKSFRSQEWNRRLNGVRFGIVEPNKISMFFD